MFIDERMSTMYTRDAAVDPGAALQCRASFERRLKVTAFVTPSLSLLPHPSHDPIMSSSESISNKVGNVTHGTVGDETLLHQATTLASHSIVYAKSWVGLAGTVESTPQPTAGTLINETRDLAASVLGTVGSVVAASTPEKVKEVASEAKDASKDAASSAQQQRPVGYVASARDLAASAIGHVQGIVASGAKKVDEQAAGSNGSLSSAASQAVGGAATTASQVGDALNSKKEEASRILQEAQNTAGSYAGAAINKGADAAKGATQAGKQKVDQTKKQI